MTGNISMCVSPGVSASSASPSSSTSVQAQTDVDEDFVADELENVTCTDDGADNDDEHVTHDQALGILEQEPVQEQQISTDGEGGNKC